MNNTGTAEVKMNTLLSQYVTDHTLGSLDCILLSYVQKINESFMTQSWVIFTLILTLLRQRI